MPSEDPTASPVVLMTGTALPGPNGEYIEVSTVDLDINIAPGDYPLRIALRTAAGDEMASGEWLVTVSARAGIIPKAAPLVWPLLILGLLVLILIGFSVRKKRALK